MPRSQNNDVVLRFYPAHARAHDRLNNQKLSSLTPIPRVWQGQSRTCGSMSLRLRRRARNHDEVTHFYASRRRGSSPLRKDRNFMRSRYNDVTLLTIQRAYHGCLQLSFGPHLDHSGFGNDAGPSRRRRDAAGALAAPALLGACCLGGESVSVSGGGVVDFLSLAQPAAVDIFPFYLCSDFAHDFILGFYRPFSARVFFGRVRQLQNSLLLQPPRVFRPLCPVHASRFRGHPAERHPTFSCLRAAVLHQQQSLFRWASDRCGYAK